MKKPLALMLACCMVFSMLPLTVSAAEVVASGTCGNDLTWILTEDGTMTISGSGAMYDYEYQETPWNDLLAHIRRLIVKDGVTRIGQNAFREAVNLTDVSLSDTITQIGPWAFMGAEKLTAVTLPRYLVTLEQEAFLNCCALQEIELPGTLTFFDGPFAGCTALTRAVIHGDPNIPSFMMGSTPFRNCSSLEAIEVDESHFCLMAIDGVLYQRSGAEMLLMQYPCGKQDTVYEIPQGTIQIFQMAMENADALEELIIPDSMQIIDEYSLMGCDNLHTIRFEGDAPQFGAEVLWGVTATVYYPAGNATWTEDVMHDYSGTITWIPYEVTPDNACGDNLTWNFSEDGTLTISGTGDMYDFAEAVDPAAVTVMGTGKVAPWHGVRSRITRIVIGEEVTSIGDNAFTGCAAVEAVTIPAAVSQIGQNAFAACTGLTEIVFEGDAPQIEESAFDSVEAEITYPVDNETWTEEVMENYGGDITWKPDVEVVVPTVKWSSISTSLGGNIAMNFYVELSEDLVSDPNAYIQFTFAGRTLKVALSEGKESQKNDVTVYQFSCPITSKNMTDEITAQVYNASGKVGDPKTMAVDTYCNWVIANFKDAKTVNLMKGMLNYGASAQLLFKYRTDDLANASLADADKVFGAVDASAFAHSTVGTEEGIKARSMTLLLDSETTVRVYFELTGDKTIDQYTFTVDGVEVTPTYKDGKYYVERPNISAHRLDDMHVFTCGGITVTYGGLSYVNQVMTYYTEGATFEMASALYAYSKAAEAYIG